MKRKQIAGVVAPQSLYLTAIQERTDLVLKMEKRGKVGNLPSNALVFRELITCYRKINQTEEAVAAGESALDVLRMIAHKQFQRIAGLFGKSGMPTQLASKSEIAELTTVIQRTAALERSHPGLSQSDRDILMGGDAELDKLLEAASLTRFLGLPTEMARKAMVFAQWSPTTELPLLVKFTQLPEPQPEGYIKIKKEILQLLGSVFKTVVDIGIAQASARNFISAAVYFENSLYLAPFLTENLDEFNRGDLGQLQGYTFFVQRRVGDVARAMELCDIKSKAAGPQPITDAPEVWKLRKLNLVLAMAGQKVRFDSRSIIMRRVVNLDAFLNNVLVTQLESDLPVRNPFLSGHRRHLAAVLLESAICRFRLLKLEMVGVTSRNWGEQSVLNRLITIRNDLNCAVNLLRGTEVDVDFFYTSALISTYLGTIYLYIGRSDHKNKIAAGKDAFVYFEEALNSHLQYRNLQVGQEINLSEFPELNKIWQKINEAAKSVGIELVSPIVRILDVDASGVRAQFRGLETASPSIASSIPRDLATARAAMIGGAALPAYDAPEFSLKESSPDIRRACLNWDECMAMLDGPEFLGGPQDLPLSKTYTDMPIYKSFIVTDGIFQ